MLFSDSLAANGESMDYTTVKVPVPLARRIESVSESHGYRSVSEFVIESIRYRLDHLDSASAQTH